MPRNKRGGNKAKKGKNAPKGTGRSRPLVIKDKTNNELYGKVITVYGGSPCVLEIECEDKINRKCVVRGKQRKIVWMKPGDYVLLEYNNDNCGEVKHKYTPDEVRKLESMNELKVEDEDNNIFANDDEDDEDVNEIEFDQNYSNKNKKNEIDFEDI